MKKLITFLAAVIMVVTPLTPTADAASNPPFAVKIEAVSETVNDKSALTVSWNITAAYSGLQLRGSSGLRLAFDNTILSLMRYNGSGESYELTAELKGMQSAAQAGVYEGAFIDVRASQSTNGELGYLTIELGHNEYTYDCPKDIEVSLASIRFAFKNGKTQNDLKKDTIRLMTLSELEELSQPASVNILTAQGSVNTEYVYQSRTVQNSLDAPEFVLPIVSPPFAVTISALPETVNNKPVLTVNWNITAAYSGLKLRGSSGLRLTYDSTVLSLIRFNGLGESYELTTELKGMQSAAQTGVYEGAFIDVRACQSANESVGYVTIELGHNEYTYDCPKDTEVSLAGIRFAFKDGKTYADLKKDTIRLMSLAELEALAQPASVSILTAQADTNIEYSYQSRSGQNALDAPEIITADIPYGKNARFINNTWVLPVDYQGIERIDFGSGWQISFLFEKDETNCVNWEAGTSHVTVNGGSVFSGIIKLESNTSKSVKYVGIEKLISVNKGIFDGVTWIIPETFTGNAVLHLLDWEIDMVFTNDIGWDNNETTFTVTADAGTVNAIIKLKHTRTDIVKYIGVMKP